ncbi:MAG: hypothetical protein NW223_10880 [Hyphomicrobiaceae bacterium]|nr:hypothetical protein [Hyphomicrobiaceae bacterium]
MRFGFLIVLLLAGCAQPQGELVTGSLAEPGAAAEPAAAKKAREEEEQQMAAIWEPVRPALQDYMSCAVRNAAKVAFQAEDPRLLAATATGMCSVEYQRTRDRLAQFYGAERAFAFGDEVKAKARETAIRHIVEVRAKAREKTEPVDGKDAEKPPAPAGQGS